MRQTTVQGVSDVIHERRHKPSKLLERDRMARRADKWWRSVWHVQMLMRGRGEPLSKANPLTDDVGRGFLKAQSPTKTKPTDMSDGPTDGEPRWIT